MQAVILAAGNGVRFWPMSITKPKPLFSVFGKTILEYNLDQLVGVADEVIIVVGYKGEMIEELIKDNYRGIKITYIKDENISGTGSAAKLAFDNLEEKFLLLNGDDLYFKEDIKKVVDSFPCVLVKEHNNPSAFGVVSIEGDTVKEIIEKPENPPTNLINAALYYIPKSIFNYNVEKSARGEYEFTDYLKQFINENDLHFVVAKNWFPASYPWDVLDDAMNTLFKNIKKEKQGEIEKNVTIKGEISVGKGTIIKSGVYIEGPVYIGKDCIVGPNCFIRGCTSIGDNCKIGQAVEIKNSIVGSNTNVSHLSYVGDSIVGSGCNIGAGTITANLRHDEENVKTKIKDKKIDTGRRKFGTVIGDNVKTGISTIIFPGKKIWPNKMTLPGQKVEEDIE
jgi:bifunctional UDP-N-acetylglucosamine pyrophosphorylase/glucosamine-1-phosphate N-acetyltransferase